MLRTRWHWLVAAAFAAGAAGCILPPDVRNPFLTLTETLGIAPVSEDDPSDSDGGSGVDTEDEFRRTMTVTFANNSDEGDLNASFVAWVGTQSIRSAEQQDALLRGGYRQLTRTEQLGTVFSLPPGTFVFNGAGKAGATSVVVPVAAGAASTDSVTLITPDVFLVFSQPPVSCDSVAFSFTVDGEPLSSTDADRGVFGGATGSGGLKTLAQIDAYQCEPLRPGLFIKLGGGAKQPNEYFEGENVRIDFDNVPNADGNAAVVTISE